MRKMITALALATALAGCAQLQEALQAGKLLTASVSNPVTRERLKTTEDTLAVAFGLLNAYKSACIKGAADVNCKSNIRAIQVYTRKLPPLLARLRSFVNNNDQVNAIMVFNELKSAYDNAKNVATTAAIPGAGAL